MHAQPCKMQRCLCLRCCLNTGCCAQVWDSQALTCLRTLEGHEDNVRVLAVGDSYVFSGSWDKSIRCASLIVLPSLPRLLAYDKVCALSLGIAVQVLC